MNAKMGKTSVYLWLILLIITAIYIRMHGANDYFLSEDESMHVSIAEADTLQEVLRESLYEAHPPMLYVLLHYWLKISGEVWFIRCLSLLFGVALIPLYYAIGKLLKDELAGLCCAALVTFSYGAIIQSYVVRHYAILLFMLSSALYCYLLWRDTKKNTALMGYTLFSVFACLTHFSAIFAVFSIAAYESILFYARKDSIAKQLTWALINIFITAIATTTYYIWLTHGIVIGGKFFSTSSLFTLIIAILVNPVKAAEYILPSIYILPLVIYLLSLPHTTNDKKLKAFFRFSFIPLGLGMFLIAINHYYPGGTRHGIWVLPFIIPICGWIIADGLYELEPLITKKLPFPSIHIMGAILLLAGFASYDPDVRFADHSEYHMKEMDRQDMLHYLSDLDNTSLIVASRDDAIMLTNLYPSLGKNAFSGKVMATEVAYLHTHILFNPYFRRLSSPSILTSTLEEAQQRHMLDGVNTLIFMKTVWDVYPEPDAPLPYLVTCPTLDKQIVTFPTFFFPESKAGIMVSDEEKKATPVAFIGIPKQEFFEQVLAGNGKSHNCLGRKAL